MKVDIEISARHLHLSAADCLKLFGTTNLVKRNNLSEIGEFASTLTVEIVGPSNRLHHVRVLGPLREKSQLELSMSDARFIGIDPPLAISGSGKGCEVKIVGHKGTIQSCIAMVAQRHFHAKTSTAKKLRLKDDMEVKLRVYGKRAVIFEKVIVRVADNFVDNIHLDTDEGNACGITNAGKGELITR